MAASSGQRKRRFGAATWRWVRVVAILLLLTVALLWPAIQAARRAARRANCVGTLKFLGVAMHNYLDVYGSFPPAYLADGDGQPMHSWRVLLLPGFGGDHLYSNYRFKEPWDSTNNIELARHVPSGMVRFCSTYRCPAESGGDEMDATYLMPVGPGAFSDGPNARTREEITDGTACTVVAAERSESGIHWMEPRDLDTAVMEWTINNPAGNGIRSPHAGVANAVFADGSVHSISEDIDPEVLRALLTTAGGEDTSALFDSP